jgi:Na+/H+ antiporter NhaD/arsenite permease-like protein
MHSENSIPNPWSIMPFGVLLATMALAPMLAPGWWSRHYPKVALGLGAITVIYYWAGLQAGAAVGQAVHEYFSFVTLVGGLFVISGGIHIGIKGQGRPLVNVGFLLAGAVLANVLGTTGAAMLLIRPWMRLNQTRIRAYHIVFFIFIVANVGGCLTPIGDPPLFLGYLQGVPFWWVARNCWPMWLVGVGLLLGIFYGIDTFHLQREERINNMGTSCPHPDTAPQWRLEGRAYFLFLAVMLGAVFLDHPVFLREGLMVLAALGSWFTTKKSVHEANGFNFHPLQEVAILFAGIFATMMPALDWLQLHAGEVLGHTPLPGVFFWGTGSLSAVLDNAPTYLAFFSSLQGVTGVSDTVALLQRHGDSVVGISVGAVFFGAATYIGNGPNLMVKTMADQEKIPMPSFVGWVLKYAFPGLLPVLVILWLVFFHS